MHIYWVQSELHMTPESNEERKSLLALEQFLNVFSHDRKSVKGCPSPLIDNSDEQANEFKIARQLATFGFNAVEEVSSLSEKTTHSDEKTVSCPPLDHS